MKPIALPLLAFALLAPATAAQSESPQAGPTICVSGIDSGDVFASTGQQIAPPSTSGAVGPDHFFQMTRGLLRIYDKSGVPVAGAPNGAFFASLGSPCSSPTETDGDPIVLYDRVADRWVVSQFMGETGNVCMAVSTSSNAASSYWMYNFTPNVGYFTDSPRMSVWGDSYCATMRVFDSPGGTYLGTHIVAFERNKLLVGDGSAIFILFPLVATGGPPVYEHLAPFDQNGSAQPPGTPIPLAQIFDDQLHGTGAGSDGIQLFAFAPDWANRFASTFTPTTFVPTDSFDSIATVPQKGGPDLEAHADELMPSVNFLDLGALKKAFFSHTVDAGGGRAGIRWGELRDSGSGWGIHQSGTHAPNDGQHRWMPSIAANDDGDIGLCYSAASDNKYPSMMCITREEGDPLGQLTSAEYEPFPGGGAQLGSSRWGDYCAMNVDPSDGTSFWCTSQYVETTGFKSWATGVVKLEAGSAATNYCVTGTSASGCTPTLSAVGKASPTAGSGFVVTASGVEGSKPGMFFFSQNGPQANPWGNGTSYQCVAPPVQRGGLLPGAGTIGACDGSFSQDLNGRWCLTGCSKPTQAPTPGQDVYVQCWYRDPQSTSNQSTSLTDAIQAPACP